MKSFPGTANEGKLMYGNTQSTTLKDTFDIERIKALNLNSSVPVIQEMLKESNINASNYQQISSLNTIDINSSRSDSTEKVYYENPLQLPAELIALAKDYEWIYKYAVKSPVSSGERSNGSIKINIANTTVVPSMFNPMYGVMATGLTRNTPLLNDMYDAQLDPNIDDCSIRTLCALSKDPNSILGMARYKYADFMYCKDLGKVANNHLITLRKFAHPVPDHIFEMTSPKYVGAQDTLSFRLEPDVGRLVSWFGTDDNKLEDICRFSYHASWKELTSQPEVKDTKADSENTGIIGMFANGMSADYSAAVNAGVAGTHSIWGWLGSKILPGTMRGIGSNNELLTNYDNNKVYTPVNTIQSNHIYEGKLEFSHEFTLNFSYQLRGYDNINPRSALTDLIGNILEVTYRRGKFWGGSRKLIGPPQDQAPFDKVNSFIDYSWDKVGGWLQNLMRGGLNLNSVMGQLGGVYSGLANLLNNANSIIGGNGIGDIANEVASLFKDLVNSTGFANASAQAKGFLKNALGRPQMYAWQSLVKGDDVGLWHVTIGNPKNPILSIGNLILTNAELSHSGPLGIDDFPSELKVSVTLKHARPRDITDIGRMYTKGASALYHHFAGHKLSDFFPTTSSDVQDNANTKDATINTLDETSVKTQVSSDAREIQKNPAQSVNEEAMFYGYMDPVPKTDKEFKMMRNGTYSDIMLRSSIEEVA